jgi:redox-sensitive bicupin YhaK (pirin superfamily)
MSWQAALEPECIDETGAIELRIESRGRDLGGFEVRRVLPSAKRRTVGPFIFFDEMGPAVFEAGKGIDVRPHPHIGLATITYLFEGEILHRDSLGFVQPIRPGALNWMTAGRGIVHSERSGPEERAKQSRLHGIQAWIALPADKEETEPAFEHYPDSAIPAIERDGLRLRLIAGEAFGLSSPVKTLSPLFYLEARGEPGASLTLPQDLGERAVYPIEGHLEIGGEELGPGEMAVLAEGRDQKIELRAEARFMALGGAPLESKRHIWWNFVSSRSERIEQAKADWREGRFASVPGEVEFIPLPED